MAGDQPARVRKPGGERADEPLTLMLTPDEMDAVRRAAEADFDEIGAWARRALVRAAIDRFRWSDPGTER